MNVLIKPLHPDALPPVYSTAGAAAFDLFSLDGAAPLLLAACGSHEAPALSDGLPDGTRCVAVLSRSGSGIDCNFSTTR